MAYVVTFDRKGSEKSEGSQAEKDLPAANNDGHSNSEGTRHQAALGSKSRCTYLFAPLDKKYAKAVQKDAEEVEFNHVEERKVRRKIDNVILPLIVCSYTFSQFDRTNIANAHLQKAFNVNYSITDNSRWLLCLSVFYIGFGLLEIPANVLLRKIGANRFFFLSLIVWGVSSLSFVYAKGYGGLIVLRVLLGIGEAGFHAGMIFYLSFWYKRNEIALMIGATLNGTVPGAIGGLLAFGLTRAHTKYLVGWQLLYLVESIPTIVMGFLVLFLLPNFPYSATFLTPRERAIAQARLNRDQKPRPQGGMTGWQGFKAIVKDPNAWLFLVCHASFNIGVSTVSYFLPTLVKELGYSSINASGIAVAPHAVGFLLVVFQAWHSDRTKERGWHAMASALITFVGYTILATCAEKNIGASFFALFLVVGGNFSLFPLILGWAANSFSPTSKRGVGVAFIISISNCILVASSEVYFDPEDRYRKAHGITAGLSFLTFAMSFIIHFRLKYLNKRNQKRLAALTEEERQKDVGEIWDNDPRYVFVT